jgi:hypothetical protein
VATWEPRVPQQGAPFPRRLGRQKAGRPTRLSPCKPATMARWTCTPRASVHTSSISPHREPIVCSQAQSERAQPAWLESTTPGGYESKGHPAPEQTLHIHPSSSFPGLASRSSIAAHCCNSVCHQPECVSAVCQCGAGRWACRAVGVQGARARASCGLAHLEDSRPGS